MKALHFLIPAMHMMIRRGFPMAAMTALFFLNGPSCKHVDVVKNFSMEVHEGTELAFDLSPDGQTIAFDLLGQIWLLPVGGGEARAITDSVQEEAEHLFPTFIADGTRILFWEARPESWGLSSINLSGEERLRLTEIDSDTDSFHSYSAKDGAIVFARREKLMLIGESDSEQDNEIKIEGLPNPGITDPAWTPDGRRLAFVNAPSGRWSHRGGRLWEVKALGGIAEPLTQEGSEVRSPVYSPDGRKIAFFLRNEDRSFELRVLEPADGHSRKLVKNEHITPRRIRWSPDGEDLFYCSEGRIWRISEQGGPPKEIPFTARLSLAQKRVKLGRVRFPESGDIRSARGHMGFVLSPNGQQIGAIALGKLWVWKVGEKPEVVETVPLSASGLCWSPDNLEVAWSAGPAGIEDLFATNTQTGLTRRLTDLPGTNVKASWSPDGRYIAFLHLEGNESGIIRERRNTTLRVMDLTRVPVSEISETLELMIHPGPGRTGILGPNFIFSGKNLWDPDSQWILSGNQGSPCLILLNGEKHALAKLPADHQTVFWGPNGSLIYQQNYRLWSASFDPDIGVTGEPRPLSEDPALYPSTSNDGSVLYVSSDGWRIRRPSGKIELIGWPLSYQVPQAPANLLIRNVRIIDGTGCGDVHPADILIDDGRIKRISDPGRMRIRQGTEVIEGEGRTVIPGLIDAHVHCWDQVLLPEFLYEGITTVRDMGMQLAWGKGFQESVAAGIQPGPRIILGGLQLWPSLLASSRSGNPNGWDGYERVLAMAEAFDLGHIKMYGTNNPHSGARFIEAAHEKGFPVSSHFGYPLPLVAAGIDSKEHLLGPGSNLRPRSGGELYEDVIQLWSSSGVGLVPTIDLPYRTIAALFDQSIIEEAQASSFFDDRLESYMRLAELNPSVRNSERVSPVGSENVARFHEAGVPLAAGTDAPFNWIPWMLHREIEQYVRAGLPPLEALLTATRNAARLLRADEDIGTVEEGKLADMIILDADPLEDIRNTRRIWKVIQGGKVVDREALKNWLSHEAREVAEVGENKDGEIPSK